MENKKTLGDLSWGLLSKYRAELMGIAIIWVILYHGTATKMIFPEQIDLLNIILKCGNNGVDIFLFLSGIGLYYSFSKNPNISEFYKRRIIRVVIPYIFISGFFWILQDIFLEKDIIQFVKDFMLISFWTQGIIRVWYIALILLLYILYPLIYRFLFKKEYCVEQKGIVLIFAVIAFNFVIMREFPVWYDMVEIALTRIPVFILGSICGKYVKAHKKITFNEGLILIVLFNFKLFFNRYTISGFPVRYWYGILAISVCIFFCMIFEILPDNPFIRKCNQILKLCGEKSLELYLAHIWVRRIFIKADFDYMYNGYNLNKWGILNYLLIL